ncbi:MAG: SMC-Scp complex subunit ScpB [Deltaproteobacteria bacterium]|nr:SMC-Scp complex subunit ScpB [Deltaproteobacteria bacterium]
MEHSEMKKVIEAILFASGRPLSVGEIRAAFDEEVSTGMIHEILELLKGEYEQQGRAFRLVEVGGGYQLRTGLEWAPWLRKLEQKRPPRLSVPALETLAIVAYRQPVTRPELEEVRGVDSGGVLKGLLDRRLVRVIGKKDEPGCPLIYATTPEFLSTFGLKDLSDLPSPKDFEERAVAAVSAARENEVEPLFEDTSSLALRLSEMDDEEKEAFNLLEKGLKDLKDIEKGLEGLNEEQPLGGSPLGESPLDKEG